MQIKKGFTLVELLIVIALVAILTLLALFQFKTQILKAYDKKRKDHLYRLKVALEEYYTDHNCYPESLPDCGVSFSPYLPQIPCDPQTKQPYEYVNDESSCPQYFKLYANLKYTKDPDIQKIGCFNGCGAACDYNYGVCSTNTELDTCAPSVTPTPTAGPTSTSSPTSTPTAPTPTPNPELCTCGSGCFACVGGICQKVADFGSSPACFPNYCEAECGVRCEADDGEEAYCP